MGPTASPLFPKHYILKLWGEHVLTTLSFRLDTENGKEIALFILTHSILSYASSHFRNGCINWV